MPVNLTLKNIPDDVYRRLKESAEEHRRSMNSEAIVCLERILHPQRIQPEERIERARRLRRQLGGSFSASDISDFKKAGRS